MATVLERIRKFQYEQYFLWLILSAVAVGLILHFSPRGSSVNQLGLIVCLQMVCYGAKNAAIGRWWPLDNMLTAFLMTREGKSTLQTGGIVFAVAIGVVVSKSGPWMVLAFCCYSFSISRFMAFRVKFDYTMAWICTAATAAWTVPGVLDFHEDRSLILILQAVAISVILTMLIFMSNYFDDYEPATRALYNKGRKGLCGGRSPPVNRNCPPCGSGYGDDDHDDTEMQAVNLVEQPVAPPAPYTSPSWEERLGLARNFMFRNSVIRDHRERLASHSGNMHPPGYAGIASKALSLMLNQRPED